MGVVDPNWSSAWVTDAAMQPIDLAVRVPCRILSTTMAVCGRMPLIAVLVPMPVSAEPVS